MHMKRLAPVAIAGALALTLVACGGDDDDASDTTAAAAAPTTAAAAPTTEAAGSDTTMDHGSMPMDHPTIEVEGIDYRFDKLPAEVEAGTMFSFKNTSTKEFHEMVALRIPDSETRPVDELVTLSEAEIDALFGEAMPALVMVAGPGEDGIPVLGDGSITEPGRYVFICNIPIGADPAAVAEAMQTESSGPPNLGDGPPHFTAGMYAEVTVTA